MFMTEYNNMVYIDGKHMYDDSADDDCDNDDYDKLFITDKEPEPEPEPEPDIDLDIEESTNLNRISYDVVLCG